MFALGDSTRISVLLVDDNPLDRELTRLGVGRVNPDIQIKEVDSADCALSEVTHKNYDCIVSDYQMPGSSGLQLLKSLRSRGVSIPFIFLTGQGNESLASEALRTGANDYFTKDIGFAHYDRLINSIQRVVESERNRKQQQEAELKRIESEEQLRQIIELMPFPVLIFWPDGRTRFVNPAFIALFGIRSVAAFVGSFNVLRNLPLDELGLRSSIEQAFRGENAPAKEVRLRADMFRSMPQNAEADGDKDLTGEFTIYPVSAAGKYISQIVMIIKDVTARVDAEHALRTSEREYRQLFDELWSGFADHEVICDEAGNPVDYRFLRINPAFERFTGLDPQRLIGKTVTEVLPGTEKEWIEQLGRVGLTGEPIHFVQYAREFGKFFEVNAYCPEHGRFAAMFHDVTAIKLAEESMQKNAARMKGIFNAAAVGIGISVNRTLEEVNEELCAMLGYEREELFGASARILYRSDREFEEAGAEMYRNLESPGVGTAKHVWRARDGSTFAVNVRYTLINEADITEGIVFVAHRDETAN